MDYWTARALAELRGLKVPEVLLSGNHALIDKWRLEQSLERTAERRPDIYLMYRQSMDKRLTNGGRSE